MCRRKAALSTWHTARTTPASAGLINGSGTHHNEWKDEGTLSTLHLVYVGQKTKFELFRNTKGRYALKQDGGTLPPTPSAPASSLLAHTPDPPGPGTLASPQLA